jgi:hypothetical protein
MELVEWELLERRAAAFEFQEQEARTAPLPGEPEPVNPAQEVGDCLKVIRDLLAPLLPYLPGIYTDEVVAEVAAKVVPVMDKYGLSVEGVGDLFGPELSLAVTVLPLAYVTYKVHGQYKAALEAERTVEMPKQPERPAPVAVAPVRAMVAVRDTGGQLSMQGA